MVLHEGRNHIVRRLLASVGHPVLRLSRTAIGPVRLGQLKTGAVRELTADELGSLLTRCLSERNLARVRNGERLGFAREHRVPR